MKEHFSFAKFSVMVRSHIAHNLKHIASGAASIGLMGAIILFAEFSTIRLENLRAALFYVAGFAALYAAARVFHLLKQFHKGPHLLLLPASNGEKFLALLSAAALLGILTLVIVDAFLGLTCLTLQAIGKYDYTTAGEWLPFIFNSKSLPCMLAIFCYGLAYGCSQRGHSVKNYAMDIIGLVLLLSLPILGGMADGHTLLACLAMLTCALLWGWWSYIQFKQAQIPTTRR